MSILFHDLALSGDFKRNVVMKVLHQTVNSKRAFRSPRSWSHAFKDDTTGMMILHGTTSHNCNSVLWYARVRIASKAKPPQNCSPLARAIHYTLHPCRYVPASSKMACRTLFKQCQDRGNVQDLEGREGSIETWRSEEACKSKAPILY